MNTSNKTQKGSRVKTVLVLSSSAPKLFISGFFVFAAAVIFGVIIFSSRTPAIPTVGKCIKNGNSCVMSLEEAMTDSERQQGLSGRAELPTDKGMLFTFKNAGRQCMWMKEMKFNIDIVWLDASSQVISVKENVSPDTYPQEFCEENASYVIETKAGAAKLVGIAPGAKVNF